MGTDIKHFMEGKTKGSIEVTGKGGSRRKQLIYDLEKRVYWVLKEEAVDRTLWRCGFGRGCGPVLRQAAG